MMIRCWCWCWWAYTDCVVRSRNKEITTMMMMIITKQTTMAGVCLIKQQQRQQQWQVKQQQVKASFRRVNCSLKVVIVVHTNKRESPAKIAFIAFYWFRFDDAGCDSHPTTTDDVSHPSSQPVRTWKLPRCDKNTCCDHYYINSSSINSLYFDSHLYISSLCAPTDGDRLRDSHCVLLLSLFFVVVVLSS